MSRAVKPFDGERKERWLRGPIRWRLILLVTSAIVLGGFAVYSLAAIGAAAVKFATNPDKCVDRYSYDYVVNLPAVKETPSDATLLSESRQTCRGQVLGEIDPGVNRRYGSLREAASIRAFYEGLKKFDRTVSPPPVGRSSEVIYLDPTPCGRVEIDILGPEASDAEATVYADWKRASPQFQTFFRVVATAPKGCPPTKGIGGPDKRP